MAHAARAEPNAAGTFTKERYFRLVTEGVLEPDDRVELLEGVVVAMAQSPGHAVAGDLVAEALRRAVGTRAAVRVQRPFVAGSTVQYPIPEPLQPLVERAKSDSDAAIREAAAAVGIDALFMEVHPDPEKGLSDTATMYPLAQLKSLLALVAAIHRLNADSSN